MTEVKSTPHQCTELAFGVSAELEVAQMPSPSQYAEFEQRIEEAYQNPGSVALAQIAQVS